jgi:hypothetical protein
MTARLGGLGWEVPKLLAAMSEAPDVYFDAMAQIHLDRWTARRMALVGDAGYCASPLSGQGTSLALVGAYVLAEELGRPENDHVAAFAAYEQRMRPLVALNQARRGIRRPRQERHLTGHRQGLNRSDRLRVRPGRQWLAASAPSRGQSRAADMSGDDPTDDRAGGVDVAAGAGRRPEGLLVVGQGASGDPQREGHGVLGARVATVAQFVGGEVG